jgi:hypothetical protein
MTIAELRELARREEEIIRKVDAGEPIVVGGVALDSASMRYLAVAVLAMVEGELTRGADEEGGDGWHGC